MSVHAQVPLGGGVETAGLPDSNPDLQTAARTPDTIYKSAPLPEAGEQPASREAPRVAAIAGPASAPADPLAPPEVSSHAPVHVEKRVIERERPGPKPLLPEAPAPVITPPIHAPMVNAAQGDESRIRPGTHYEPAEVHVHIGRIEVISAPEPAPIKKAQKPAARPTIPLADFLAKKVRS